MKNQKVKRIDRLGRFIEEWLSAQPGRLTGLASVVICVLLVLFIITLLSEIYSIAASVFAGAVAIGTWAYVQYRTQAQISWDAIKEYYGEGDEDDLVKAREWIVTEAQGRRTNGSVQEVLPKAETVRKICNFWEKWGRLVEKGYLPLWIFDGPSGDSAANILRLVREDIKAKRDGTFANRRYARSYVWLVKQIRTKGYLTHWDKTVLDDLDKCLSELEIVDTDL